ncbi:hypothetical protein Tco_0700026, partial [Tanacetum coccineum]
MITSLNSSGVRNMEGEFRTFSVACVWDTIRVQANVVDW